jgi:pimeloyl-ACP methyl ester carboxylesterase
MSTSESMAPDTIVLIHGLWMTPRSWEGWIGRYEERGFKVLAPSWPGMEAEVEALNANPAPIAKLDIRRIVDHYERIIRGLDSEPIIIGHSFGGAFVQLLLGRGFGAAGVGVASATVKGVPDLPLSTIRATLPVLRNPFNRGKAVPLSPEQFHYAFANTLDRPASDEIYRRYHVPAAATVLFESALANLRRHPSTEVDFGKDDRAPMLFIAFENDHVIPPSATRHNAKKYGGSRALTAYTEFPGRPHFPAAPGWEEVADAALAWALDPSPESAERRSPAAG